ncbi:hypothetical protein MJM59_31740 [Salmonella enterica subsp. enterica serovar Montevideo]|nr:hypothetical protein [Salmonella enterica subsp. enterica serovar Montevideo]
MLQEKDKKIARWDNSYQEGGCFWNILLVQTDKANLNINLMKSTPGASQRKYLLFA